MIRLEHGDGWMLLPQSAHAWLSGQIAQHWGNEDNSRPKPYASVVLATTLHDKAWFTLDRLPLLNDVGEPLHFLELGLDDSEGLYADTVAQVTQIDPYAGILVNRHVQLIYNSRATHGRDPIDQLQPLLDTLKTDEKALITRLSSHPAYADFIDEVALNHNYRVLRTCDLLSLFVCGGFPARMIQDVPYRNNDSPIDVECQLDEPHTLRISPNLLDVPELVVHLEGRYIPKCQFEDADEYAAVFQEAPFKAIEMRILTNQS